MQHPPSPPGHELGIDAALQLLDAAEVGLFVVQDGLVRFANRAYCALVGRSAEELLGQPHELQTSPEHRQRTREIVARRLAGKPGRPGELRCQRADGSGFDARAQAVRVDFGGAPAVLVTVTDVSDLTGALRQARWSASLLERTELLCRTGSFEVRMPQERLQLSAGLLALAELPADAPRGAMLDSWSLVPESERGFVAGIWRNAVPGEAFEFQHRLLCGDGRLLTVLHRGMLLASEESDAGVRGVALLQDITAQREAELQLQDVSNHNEVTGLPNRGCFLDQVDAAAHAARWSAGAFTLLALDVPRIAEIKASMGFGAGDTLAMALAARLRAACGDGEQPAHLGDSEFAVLIEHPAETEASTLMRRARELKSALEAPVRLAATDIYARCIVGLARYPEHGESPADLLEHAQTARLGAPEHDGVAFFASESNARALREVQLESALRQAIDLGELSLHYQPQVDLASGAITGAEALLRWLSVAHGQVPPSEFIPLAERSGLIGQLGDWVLREACRQVAAWRREGLQPVRVGVNLSPAQLQRPDLARHVQSILVETGVDPGLLGVELTEGMVMTDVAHMAQVLRELRAVGVEISLDDFGTGHSSLSCLRSLPIDVVKVDRSFVHDVTAAPEDVSVTRAIINMAHGLQMRVLVEGVESEGQLALLAANRCDGIQGYWFSPPVPADAMAAMLRDGKTIPERYVTRVRRARTLLLVDDELNILTALKRLLRRDGYHIVTASSAAEALQRLADHQVDVIVSDQRMPGMTGVELLRRAKDLYPDTVRIVLSGYTELQSILDAVNEGAIYRFLTKPWDDERLRAHVAEAFEHKAMGDENRRLTRQVERANAELAALNGRLEEAVAQQRAQASLAEAGAGGMRDVLDQLPAAVLGLDADGVLSFVNREALILLPHVGELVGCAAEQALPAALTQHLERADTGTGELSLGSLHFGVISRHLSHGGHCSGQVLMLLPKNKPSGTLQ